MSRMRGGCQSHEQCGLRQGGELYFPAGTHAFEWRSRVESREDGEKPHEPHQISEQDQVAVEVKRCGCSSPRQNEERRDGGRELHHGARAEDPACRLAVDRTLAQEFGQVEIKLEEGLPRASGKEGFRPVDDSHQQGREDQGQKGEDQRRSAHDFSSGSRSTGQAG